MDTHAFDRPAIPARRLFCALLLALTLHWTESPCQGPISSPCEAGGFTTLSSYDTLATFVRGLHHPPFIAVDEIATTREGRTVFAVRISSSAERGVEVTKLRVLLFAQQHGDEPSGKEALLMLLAQAASHWLDSLWPSLDLVVIPQMNPDGAASGRRTTSDGIDLNRNHVLLTSPETKGLHDLFERFRPHVTMDIHEFSATSRAWTEAGLLKTADVQLGMLTNPNVPERIRRYEKDRVFPALSQAIADAGFKYQEYIVGSPQDRIRHSTTDINDGRQSFGILGTLSFIQEGRNGKTPEDRLRVRTESQFTGIRALLNYCREHALEIRALVEEERASLAKKAGTLLAARMDRVPGAGRVWIPVFDMKKNIDTLWQIAPFHDSVDVRSTVRIPRAYYIPREMSAAIELLRRHHVPIETLEEGRPIEGTGWSVDSLGTEVLEELVLSRPAFRENQVTGRASAGCVRVSTEHWRGLFIATVLEPESMWGLLSYREYATEVRSTGTYGVIRLP